VWTAPTMLNGWTADTPPPRYRLLGDKVELRGRVAGTTTFTGVFILPVGFRPPVDMMMPAAVVAGGAWATGAVSVAADGIVSVASGGHSNVSLGGLQFSVTA